MFPVPSDVFPKKREKLIEPEPAGTAELRTGPDGCTALGAELTPARGRFRRRSGPGCSTFASTLLLCLVHILPQFVPPDKCQQIFPRDGVGFLLRGYQRTHRGSRSRRQFKQAVPPGLVVHPHALFSKPPEQRQGLVRAGLQVGCQQEGADGFKPEVPDEVGNGQAAGQGPEECCGGVVCVTDPGLAGCNPGDHIPGKVGRPHHAEGRTPDPGFGFVPEPDDGFSCRQRRVAEDPVLFFL